MSASTISVHLAATHSGQGCYLFTHGEKELWVSADIARGPLAKLQQHLANHGIMFVTKDAAQELREKVALAELYSGPVPIDQPGWTGKNFAWPDGSVTVAAGVEEPATTYQASPVLFRSTGTMKGWQRYARDLGKQPLPLLMFTLPLAATLRPFINPTDNLLFEMVASSRAEIDVPGLLIGSVSGGVTGAGMHYTPLHSAGSNLSRADPYNDQLQVLGEADLLMAGESVSVRTDRLRSRISHHMRTAADPLVSPNTALLIGRQRLASLVGEDTDIGRLASERIVTVEVAPEREFGWLDELPDGFESLPDYNLHLRTVVRRTHGVVLREFVAKLVEEVHANKKDLIRQIEHRMAVFREHARCELNDAAAVRDADAFGLIYAAAWLAKQWGLFPGEWEVGPKLHACFRDFHTPHKSAQSFDEELARLLNQPDVLHLTAGQKKPRRSILAKEKIIVQHCTDHIELIIRPEHIGEIIPNWMQRKADPQVTRRLIKEKGSSGQAKTYRRWVKKPGRVFCFGVPLSWSSEKR